MIVKNGIRSLLFILLLGTVGISAGMPDEKLSECTSYFTWEQLATANTSIQFHNESSGNFNTWMWDFGDGTTSAIFHPVHEYSAFGTYVVCLTISDGAGCSDTYCDTVKVIPQCHAEFEFSYVPTTPIHVQFTDLSTGFPDTWSWSFGDGTGSGAQNPVHPYPEPGSYEVCLVIEHSDTLYNCSDTICKIVIIPDSVNCEAAFTYEASEMNPLELSFYDQSSGNITNREWNFGDGTVSYQQNPVHNFPEPDQYLVCLKVYNADSLASCFHFICETIDLSEPVNCEANFTAMADSGSQVMNRYFFHDQSYGNPDQWLWDFGDGHTSHEKDPVHIYEEPGTYQVCMDAWNSNYPGCNDTHCKLIQTSDYFQLGGLAFAGDNPINNPYPTGDTGIAVLYRKAGNRQMLAVDTTVFHEFGYYWFSNKMEMPYAVKIGLTKGSEHYSEYIPSYFPGLTRWEDAEMFMLDDDMYEMNTSLIPATGAEPGNGRIGGRVVQGENSRFTSDIEFHDVPVVLTDNYNNPLEWTATDANGYFEFNSLAMGSYLLYADIAGIYSVPEPVVLDEGFPVVDTLFIEMFETSSLGLDEPAKGPLDEINLYPNPLKEQLNLSLHLSRQAEVEITIFNQLGQVMKRQTHILSKGSNQIEMHTGSLPGSIYYLRVQAANGKPLMKTFIKVD
jgi:PKD repeat protein